MTDTERRFVDGSWRFFDRVAFPVMATVSPFLMLAIDIKAGGPIPSWWTIATVAVSAVFWISRPTGRSRKP